MKTDIRVDAYISHAADFAKPILSHLRNLVHAACPEIEETIKWGFPNFQSHGLVCNMAAFKQHCSFGFWKASLLKDPYNILSRDDKKSSMGNVDRITTLGDLPKDEQLISYIKEAVALNREGVSKPQKENRNKEKVLDVPEDFSKLLEQHHASLQTFGKLSYSNRKDYLDWIVEAKTAATRNKRVSTALEWLAQGKTRNWKYMKK